MSEENKKNEEIVELDNEIKTENDGIKISDDVVAVIAGVAVSEVPGVAGMAGGFAGGISEVFSGKKNLAKGIKVDVADNNTKIDVLCKYFNLDLGLKPSLKFIVYTIMCNYERMLLEKSNKKI